MRRHDKHRAAVLPEMPRAFVKRPPPVEVTCPHEDETISPQSYTIQVATADPAAGVDVSIDQGDWRPCREALGLWWFDWAGYDPGEHEVTARLRAQDGRKTSSEPRIFFVR